MSYELNFETEPFEAYLSSDDTLEIWDGELTDLEEEEEIRRGRRAVRPSGFRLRPGRPPRPPKRLPQRPQPPRSPVVAGRRVVREPAPCSCPAHGTEFIRWVQSSLNQVLGLNLAVSGVMDAPTRSALRRFQEQQGLAVDGIAGPETEKALIDAKGGQSGQGEELPEWGGFDDFNLGEIGWQGEVNRGSRDYIRWVQQSLNGILGLGLAVDGISGPQTRSAVRTFQRQRGLTVDGVVGPQTEAALIAAGSGQIPGSSSQPIPSPLIGVTYAVAPGQEYGPHWGSRLPPGLPATARQASVRGAALGAIQTAARRHGLGEVFVTVVSHLAQTESGATYARPANTFDARPPSERPVGKPLITAWGVFQFNRDAWRALPGTSATSFPWDASPAEEIDRPVARYAELFRQVRTAGGSEFAAARGVRLWHRSPAAFRNYVRTGQSSGFDAAWRAVPERHRTAVDRRMQEMGLTGGGQNREVSEFGEDLGPLTWNPEVEYSDQEVSMIILSGSVGNGGANKQHDVFAVQNLLNKFIVAGKLPGIDPLAVDGKIGSKTIAAIRAFQRSFVGMNNPDGRVDPGGATLQRLNGSIDQPVHSPMRGPANKPAPMCSGPLSEVSASLGASSLMGMCSRTLRRYGIPETIQALLYIGAQWHLRHPNGPMIIVSDISQCGGGKIPPHASHRIGLDVDLSFRTNRGASCNSGVRVCTGEGARQRTKDYVSVWRPLYKELIEIIDANPWLPVKVIWFKDRELERVFRRPDGTRLVSTNISGHDCHMHVRFCVPARLRSRLDLSRVYAAGETRADYSCR